MTEQDEDSYTNLAEIIEQDGYQETRVATFATRGDKLEIREACDDHFAVALDEVEVRRLRDWLDAWLVERSRTS